MNILNNVKKTFSSTAYCLYYSMTNPKVWVAAVIILAQIFRVMIPYAKIANDYNTSVNASVISIFYSDKFSVPLIFISLLFIFSELPFSDPQQIYHITRSGKRSWYFSQLIYIIVISISVTVIITLVSWTSLSAHLSFDDSWGRVLNTVCRSPELREKYNVTELIPEDVIANFKPRQTMVWNVLVGTSLYVVFGTVIYSLNMITHKIGGLIVGAIFITFRFFSNLLQTPFKWICPLEWCNIRVVDIYHLSKLPNPEYIISALSVMYVLSVLIVILRSRSKADIL